MRGDRVAKDEGMTDAERIKILTEACQLAEMFDCNQSPSNIRIVDQMRLAVRETTRVDVEDRRRRKMEKYLMPDRNGDMQVCFRSV